jgi:sulfhydrogenase subunit beta (sulfur reductase)
MVGATLRIGEKVVVDAHDFQKLLDVLSSKGYRLVGPTLSYGDLVYDEIASVADLPAGWADEQEGGTFRLKPRGDKALFGYGVGQKSWKQFLLPPRELIWQARHGGGAFQVIPRQEEVPRFAFIGVHPCDLSAIAVQDKVYLEGKFVEPTYRRRRANALIVAVNCSQPCGTGFCVSMGTGPKATSGFDLALTEVLKGGQHYFLAEVGTPIGAEILGEVPHKAAAAEAQAAAEKAVQDAAQKLCRALDTNGLKDLLYRSYDHSRWDDVAARCLNCGNCTSVCPTCFCHTVENFTDLTGLQAERWRRQDVCYNVDFSYIHGGSIRTSSKARYRQWLTHKLATWVDQFGCFGCIGCGRCITWCPVAIDITEEVRAIRET